jgi:EXPERA (EXPanded EBP superfamily)
VQGQKTVSGVGRLPGDVATAAPAAGAGSGPEAVAGARAVHRALPAKDRAILGILCFYILMAFSVELYWLLHADQLVTRSGTEALAGLFALYGRVDPAYYDRVTGFTRGLEAINIFITQPLNAWLMFAILRRRPSRYPVQLAVSSYLTYSVVLYFVAAAFDGFGGMRDRSGPGFLLLFVPNLPWLLPPAWMAWDAARSITAHFGRGPEGA